MNESTNDRKKQREWKEQNERQDRRRLGRGVGRVRQIVVRRQGQTGKLREQVRCGGVCVAKRPHCSDM